MSSKRCVGVATLGAAFALCSSAYADPIDREQVAQSLFEQGRTLMDQHAYGRACALLAESQRLDPGDGTLLNLALCHEGEGKLATALREFYAVEAQSRAAGRADRARIAYEHATGLTGRVPKLTLRIERQAAPVEITLDGVAISGATADAPLRADPGLHTVTASASGYVRWTGTVEVSSGHEASVAIPALVRLDTPAEPTRPQRGEWYGWPILLTDATGIAIGIYAATHEALAIGTAGGVVYGLGGPTVHWAHGNTGQGFASLALRVGTPVVIGALGLYIDFLRGLGEHPTSLLPRDFTLTVVGGAIGAAIASLIDIAALARTRGP